MTVSDFNDEGNRQEPQPSDSAESDGAGDGGGSRRRRNSRGLRFLGPREIFDQPKRDHLVEGVLPLDCIAVLYAKYGRGKTFLALYTAMCVLTGSKWFGKEVKQGVVVYVMAEGIRGLKNRLRALCGADIANNDPIWTRLHVLPHAVNLLDPKVVDALSDLIRELPERPSLIVIDTLARCTVGGDENSAKDMGLFVDSCDRLRVETGATILVIHHAGKNNEAGERGSSSLGGAAEVMMEITEANNLYRLVSRKQKEGGLFEPMHFRLLEVHIDDETGATSCVVQPVNEPSSSDPEEEASPEETDQSKIARSLRECKNPDGMTGPELIAATGIKSATFYRRLKEMKELGVVIEVGASPARYRLSPQDDAHSHSHSQGPLGGNGTESGDSHSHSQSTPRDEAERGSEHRPEEDIFGDETEEDYHGGG